MKLPIIVPRWSRVTLGMPRAPETRATMPYGLLPDLQRPARAGGCPGEQYREIQISVKNASFFMISWIFNVLATGTPSPLRPLRAAARRRRSSLEARQEVVGHRSTRFRARGHPQSGPGQPGNDLGKFHFWSKRHEFS